MIEKERVSVCERVSFYGVLFFACADLSQTKQCSTFDMKSAPGFNLSYQYRQI